MKELNPAIEKAQGTGAEAAAALQQIHRASIGLSQYYNGDSVFLTYPHEYRQITAAGDRLTNAVRELARAVENLDNAAKHAKAAVGGLAILGIVKINPPKDGVVTVDLPAMQSGRSTLHFAEHGIELLRHPDA